MFRPYFKQGYGSGLWLTGPESQGLLALRTRGKQNRQKKVYKGIWQIFLWLFFLYKEEGMLKIKLIICTVLLEIYFFLTNIVKARSYHPPCKSSVHSCYIHRFFYLHSNVSVKHRKFIGNFFSTVHYIAKIRLPSIHVLIDNHGYKE